MTIPEFTKSTVDAIEERVGKPLTTFMVWMVWLAFVCLPIIVVVTMVNLISSSFSPFVVKHLPDFGGFGVPDRGTVTVITSVLSGVLAVIAILKLQQIAQGHLKTLNTRLESVYADLRDTVNDVHTQLQVVRERIVALESFTDIHGLAQTLALQEIEEAENAMLTIQSARYGIGPADGESVDVMARVEAHKQSGSIHMVVSNDSMGQHIFQGQKKYLYLIYTYDGRQRRIKVTETHILQLPEPNPHGTYEGW